MNAGGTLAVEKMNLVRAYRVKMHEVKKQLADEKELVCGFGVSFFLF